MSLLTVVVGKMVSGPVGAGGLCHRVHLYTLHMVPSICFAQQAVERKMAIWANTVSMAQD